MVETQRLSIVRDPADQAVAQGPVVWALEQLCDALAARGVSVQMHARRAEAPAGGVCLLIAGHTSPAAGEVLRGAGVSVPAAPESLGLVPGGVGGRSVLLACGSDTRGLVYAVLELADRVEHAEGDPLAALRASAPAIEQPANPIRSIMRLFASEVEDKPWFYDRAFWRRYLSMLVAQRFNRFNLALGLSYDFPRRVRDAYFYFAYPFLVSVPGYEVRVTGLSDAERERNLSMLRFISEEAVARGLHFQLGLWTHAYELIDSPETNYTVEGVTAENHAAYCRDAVRTLLEACPAINGVTVRIHGESGIPEESYEFWRTVFDGVAQVSRSGRQIELDMHAKGIDQKMVDIVLEAGLPANVSPKYWAEHMGLPYHQASIREVEQPRPVQGDYGKFMALSVGSRRFTRYGYADLLAEDRRHGVLFRIWPGTQRLLLWGDPAMAAGYGRHASFSGSLGMEVFEPLSFSGRRGSGLAEGHEPYTDASLRPAGGDWEKYLYTYRLLGRLLYNPHADPESWRRWLRREFGQAADHAEAALANASRILLLVTTAHLPSAANNSYWPELYTNMPLVDEARPHPYGDTPSPKRFGTVSPLDPELFSSPDDFASEIAGGQRSGKYSPLDVAGWLDGFASRAAAHLAAAEGRIADRAAPAFRRWSIDVSIQSSLGRFFAQKLRAAVAYGTYVRTKDVATLRDGLHAYRLARNAWAEAVEHAHGVYRDDLTFGPEPHLRGHWSDRLAAIDQDVADMEAALEGASAPAPSGAPPATHPPRTGPAAVASAPAASRAPAAGVDSRPSLEHAARASFVRGEAVSLELALGDAEGSRRPITAELRYRHVNQGEMYQAVEMVGEAGRYRATISGEYTDSPYPLQYFFVLRDGHEQAWLYPGLGPDLSNQPYFLARQG